jgi:COP9 signalosome complex subunit 1
MAPPRNSSKDAPKLELESYIANYDGPIRLDRLIAVANANSILSTDALRLAVIEAKKTLNSSKYTQLADRLRSVSPKDALGKIDKDYVQITSRKTRAETDRLEMELKQYKNNLIKESIRVSAQTE